VNGKQESGEIVGLDPTDGVRLLAREGYAIGGMVGKAGWWCNGFALIYMKIKPDGSLDPKERYESEWVGWFGEDQDMIRTVGGGRPVIGLVGKIVGSQTTALGLQFQGQEFTPTDPRRRR
jgi:hypothetical protein